MCDNLSYEATALNRFELKREIKEEYRDTIKTVQQKFRNEDESNIISKIVECNDTFENWYKMFNYKQDIMGINSIILDLAICIMVIDCDNEDYTIYLVDR